MGNSFNFSRWSWENLNEINCEQNKDEVEYDKDFPIMKNDKYIGFFKFEKIDDKIIKKEVFFNSKPHIGWFSSTTEEYNKKYDIYAKKIKTRKAYRTTYKSKSVYNGKYYEHISEPVSELVDEPYIENIPKGTYEYTKDNKRIVIYNLWFYSKRPESDFISFLN